MARENPTWGYDRIQGALANLVHEISDSTVANILKEHGIEPAPQRRGLDLPPAIYFRIRIGPMTGRRATE